MKFLATGTGLLIVIIILLTGWGFIRGNSLIGKPITDTNCGSENNSYEPSIRECILAALKTCPQRLPMLHRHYVILHGLADTSLMLREYIL